MYPDKTYRHKTDKGWNEMTERMRNAILRNKNAVQLKIGVIIVIIMAVVSITAFVTTKYTAWDIMKNDVHITYSTIKDGMEHVNVMYKDTPLFNVIKDKSTSQQSFTEKLTARTKESIQSMAENNVCEKVIMPVMLLSYISIMISNKIIDKRYETLKRG